ncbi:hypothetical protein C2869_04530 [Saccharobesus litoralis]|uniref:GyrI-like small molecule binding domain-containing protein n=1 Tax=Saccharobesus litoralis TaxID=2172099 RepID=A0A2S0VNF1_9ALTE|nr:SRPBCC family protein [Saccharobesus litoralis]AWB65748.1 hypothetical protein C2869_04530 [Saccharobesus litoralis]
MISISFSLDRSIEIAKPIEEVFQFVADFNNWRSWSAWIIQEPQCPVTIEGEPNTQGHKQTWDGDLIGKGSISIASLFENQYLDFDLHFFAPWKSHSKTQFKFSPIEMADGSEGTSVTWAMQGSLPVFMFFFKKMMTAMIGSDYERGLAMLKEKLETGSVTSAVDINGVSEQKGFYYIGYPVTCHKKDISQKVSPLFEKLCTADLPKPDKVLTVVNKFDMVSEQCDMVVAFAYPNKPDFTVPDGMIMADMPNHQALEVLHTGSYHHLSNGWTTLMCYLRHAKLKANKRLKEYEVYLNSPAEVPSEQLKTAIYAPLK